MTAMQTLLVVDDVPENLTILGELLKSHYRVRMANSGARALQVAASDPVPDALLLDIIMPEMDGYAVLQRLRENPTTRDIPVIFVTAKDSAEDEEFGLALGAVDYITKPIQPATLLARVRLHLELKRNRDERKGRGAAREEDVARRLQENLRVVDVSIRTLAGLAEARDPGTGNHLVRAQAYVRTLGRRLATHRRFEAFLAPAQLDAVATAAPLHDIGKAGIPDVILFKPGKLTAEEWEVMKTHARFGSEAIEQSRGDSEAPVEFPTVATEIARWHHEWWDGSGYPDGLAGDAIPVGARLMALADAFDALVTRRVYREPVSIAQAVQAIVEGKGSHFDPDIVEAFLSEREAFTEILARHPDTGKSAT